MGRLGKAYGNNRRTVALNKSHQYMARFSDNNRRSSRAKAGLG
jgi:hypothetical protein